MVEELRTDVEKLIAAYERVKDGYSRVSEELRRCKEENLACKEHIVELERQIDNYRLKEAFRSSEDDNEAKVRIESILEEVDKCISLLEG